MLPFWVLAYFSLNCTVIPQYPQDYVCRNHPPPNHLIFPLNVHSTQQCNIFWIFSIGSWLNPWMWNPQIWRAACNWATLRILSLCPEEIYTLIVYQHCKPAWWIQDCSTGGWSVSPLRDLGPSLKLSVNTLSNALRAYLTKTEKSSLLATPVIFTLTFCSYCCHN